VHGGDASNQREGNWSSSMLMLVRRPQAANFASKSDK